ncbi:MAG: dephospho-CoA kinase [Proteobacteria bacterium]|nr:dephospho-CoA kinase [Pseudomonadota bacterium]MBU1581347.1 dephospho-CoA kinase [Pseudomonadota bacterium]MBU2451970.1 dephospho-CoA kinase [Pseudomonadota bacterium]MBU2627434.1 dephospho-CoA kinase [Pseudomonadota bacterium]
MKILKIAVTGSAGSGKSLVCKRLKEIGLVTLDCDVIARQVVVPGQPAYKKIVELFGQKVVRKDKTLDRTRLRNIIVNDSGLRKKMENILHPQILREMIFQMETAVYTDKKRAVAVEVPLLFESGMAQYFDVTIVVAAKDKDLVKRICDRDMVTKQDAQKMLDLQMPQDEKTARADHVIINKGTNAELSESVDNLFEKIQKEFLTT